MEHYFSHIFFVLTPISEILAFTPSLNHDIQLFQLFCFCLCYFMYCFLFVHVCVCVIMKRRAVRGKSKCARKSNNNLARKASDLPPLHILFYPNNSILIYFTLLLYCINLMGNLLGTLPSLFTQTLEHWVQNEFLG